MIRFVLIALIVYACQVSPVFGAAVKTVMLAVSIVTILILFKIGFIGVLLAAVFGATIDFFEGVFGLAYHLLVD